MYPKVVKFRPGTSELAPRRHYTQNLPRCFTAPSIFMLFLTTRDMPATLWPTPNERHMCPCLGSAFLNLLSSQKLWPTRDSNAGPPALKTATQLTELLRPLLCMMRKMIHLSMIVWSFAPI